MPPKSNFWQYYEKCEDKNFAICRLYSKQIKTSGNTSNLKSHLEAMHKNVSKSHFQFKSQQTNLSCFSFTSSHSENKNVTTSDTPSTSTASTPISFQMETESDTDAVSMVSLNSSQEEAEKSNLELQSESSSFSSTTSTSKTYPRQKQRTISDSISKLISYTAGGRNYHKITNSVMFMICRDYQPTSIVENEGFVQLIHTICPQYKLPCRKTMSKLIDNKYIAITNFFKEKIKNADNFTLTSDIWTETMKSKSFLGVTLHFLDKNKITDATLGIYELKERHTSEYIAECLRNVCQEWEIPDQKISCVVTDGAANTTKAVDLAFGKKRHIICFAHLINLVVTKSLEQTENLSEIINKVKAIVRWFKQSVVASDALRKAQNKEEEQNQSTVLTLKQDVPTRWNSTYYRIQRFLELRAHINSIVNTQITAPAMLSAIEIRELEFTQKLLEPFESATREISGSKYTTGSIIIPIVYNLQLCLENIKAEDSPVGKALKLHLTSEINKILTTAEQINILAVATLLDPRFKKIYFKNPVHCARAVEFIYDFMKKLPRNTERKEDDEVQEQRNTDNKSTKFSLWSDHKRLVTEKGNGGSSAESDRSEIHLYLKKYNMEPLETNPIKWWQDNQHIYPSLAPLALRMLSILASSVPSERLFSKAGETITQKRNSLHGKRLSQLLLLQSVEK